MTRTRLSLCVLALLPLIGAASGRARAAGPPAESAASPLPGDPASDPSARPSLIMLPTIAVSIGPTWSLVPAASSGMAVDVTAGAVIGWPAGRSGRTSESALAMPVETEERYLRATLWLQPELGYSYERGDASNPQLSGHLGSLGLGVGYGNLLFSSVAYTPRLVVGAMGDELAVGLRHGLAGHFLGRLFSAELSHQMLWVGGELHHELRLLFGINAGALLVNQL